MKKTKPIMTSHGENSTLRNPISIPTSPSPISSDKKNMQWSWYHFFSIGILFLLAGARLLLALQSRGLSIPLPFCLFRHYTGIPCGTCGSTRSFFALAQGQIVDAFFYQPLLMIFVGLTLFLALLDISGWTFCRTQPGLTLAKKLRFPVWVFILLFIVNWAYVIAYHFHIF